MNSTVQVSTTLVTISSCILVILMVLALFGNVLVWVAFCTVKRLQRVTNFYIVSLATADLLVTTLAMPMWLLYILSGGSILPPNSPSYIIWLSLDIICGTASVLNLTFVSCDRYLAITKPLKYQTILSPNRAILTIIFSWIVAIAVSLVKFWMPREVYPLFVATTSFYIPTAIMCFTYSCIFMVARRHVRVINVISGGVRGKKFCYVTEMKAAKMIAAVIGEFLICWAPFLLTNLVLNYCKTCRMPFEAIYVIKLLQYASSCFNPYVYTSLNSEFRSAIKKLLFWRCLRSLNCGPNQGNVPMEEIRTSVLKTLGARDVLRCDSQSGILPN